VWSFSTFDVAFVDLRQRQEKSGISDGSSPDISHSNIAGLNVARGQTRVVFVVKFGAFFS
jgi:hypothetical protein